MTTDPRAALDRLVAALEAHLAAAQQRHGDDDPAVAAAYDTLADAFDTYDESLFEAYGETTPFDLFDDDDDDLDEDDDDDDDDDDDPDDEDDDSADGEQGDDVDDLDPDDLELDDFDDHVDDELEESLAQPPAPPA
jgi:hypothetical protein